MAFAVLRRLLRNRGAVIGALFLLILAGAALLAQVVAPFDPIAQDPVATLSPPSVTHPFGTDLYGRDILSRVIHGSRISLTVGLISVGIGAALGVTLGLVAGYLGGWVNMVIMRTMDVMLAFPGILLALVIMAMLGPNLLNVMIAVGLASVPTYTRLVCGSVLAAREQVYVEAARSVGAQGGRVMFRHILPNVMAPVIVNSTLGVAYAILTASSLSYLGLGAQPPSPEWGAMLVGGRDYLRQAWWLTTFPGVAIMVTVIAINMLGDGLRDVLDPRLKR